MAIFNITIPLFSVVITDFVKTFVFTDLGSKVFELK
jgi:hypothetical protein